LEEGKACPICFEPMQGPEATPYGHVLCGECLRQWLSRSDKCPTCKNDVKKDNMVSVREAIHCLMAEHGAGTGPAGSELEELG